MRSRTLKIALVVVAGCATVPSILSAIDGAAGRSDADPPIGEVPLTIDGLRRHAADALGRARFSGAMADARAVLARQPLDRRSLRILSVGADAQGDDELADDAALAASFVSWRDPYVERRLFLQMAMLGKLDDAARRADALSRMNGSRGQGFEALNRLLAMRGGADAVAARLATRPSWRDPYFRDAQGLAAAPRQGLPLLRALARTRTPASQAEVDGVLAVMVAQGLGAEAWAYARATRGTPSDALIDDPDLQSARDDGVAGVSSPFVWSMPADTMVRLVDHRDSEGRPALRVEHRGDRSALFVSRSVVAVPGRYRLSYEASGPAEELDRLHPEVRCVTGATPKVEPSARTTGTHSAPIIASAVTVPSNCGSLQLGFTFEMSESSLPAQVSIRRVAFARVG